MDAVVTSPERSALLLPESVRQLDPVIVEDLVRVGVGLDGGYVVPRSTILNAEALLSFGVGHDWSFERQAAELNPHMVIHAYDHTIGEPQVIAEIAASLQRAQRDQPTATATDAALALYEIRAHLDRYQRYRKFFSGRVSHFQERVFDRIENPRDATLEGVFSRLEGKANLVLKMDIEGDEYRILEGLLSYQDRIRLMVIEFHATEFLRDLFLEKIALLQRYYEIVHLHGNNYVGVSEDGLPDILEITFLHKTLCAGGARRGHLPLAGLDFPNNPKQEDHELRFS